MAEKLHAILNPDGTVAQVIVWDGVTPWPSSEILDVQPCDQTVGVGFKYDDGAFTAPDPVIGDEPPPIANGDANLAFGGG